jgi:N-acetylglutamate synthase-like GNAT family acetyltransferase
MLIRTATTDDANALAVLCGQLGYATDAATIVRRLGGVAAQRGGVVLVAVDEHDALVGFAHVEPRHLLIAEPFAELAALVVSESARGKHVGSSLLAAAEAWAPCLG